MGRLQWAEPFAREPQSPRVTGHAVQVEGCELVEDILGSKFQVRRMEGERSPNVMNVRLRRLRYRVRCCHCHLADGDLVAHVPDMSACLDTTSHIYILDDIESVTTLQPPFDREKRVGCVLLRVHATNYT